MRYRSLSLSVTLGIIWGVWAAWAFESCLFGIIEGTVVVIVTSLI